MSTKINQKLKALETNLAKEYWKKNQTIIKKPIGKLNLPTGQIVAVDPLCCCNQKDKFEIKINPGQYPVYLYISTENSDKRVAYAQIQITENKATEYKLALHQGESEKDTREGEIIGYPVDSGVGSFMDASATEKLKENWKTTIKQIDNQLEQTYVDTYSTADVTIQDTKLNILVFSSGYGDGVYPSYWGIDQNGDICSLITDFEIIE